MGKRYARRHDPIVPKVDRVELSEGNMVLRLLGVGIAIAVAVAALGYAINSLLTPQTGWQQMEASGSKTGFATQFTLYYDVQSTLDYRKVSTAYTEAGDAAYQALSAFPVEQCKNLYTLNSTPNEPVEIDPILYRALEQMADSRQLFYGPIWEQYNSLYQCTQDLDAEKFDPDFSPAVLEFVDNIASFAQDPQSIAIELLGDCRVVLSISEAYLQYAADNEIETFVDFGRLKNAFLLDAIAEELGNRGLVRGALSSFDGYTRVLSDGEFALDLFESGSHAANVTYNGPRAVVSLRRFPQTLQDESMFYCYADGTVRAPYIDTDGRMKAGMPNLVLLSDTLSCGELAEQAVRIFAAGTFSEANLSGDWIYSDNGIHSGGDDFQIADYTK